MCVPVGRRLHPLPNCKYCLQELDIFYKSCEWPAKISKVMKEASSKAATDHKSFEHSLKARRKEFGESLGDLENRVAAFSQYDVIARRAEHATEVRVLRHVEQHSCHTAQSIDLSCLRTAFQTFSLCTVF